MRAIVDQGQEQVLDKELPSGNEAANAVSLAAVYGTASLQNGNEAANAVSLAAV